MGDATAFLGVQGLHAFANAWSGVGNGIQYVAQQPVDALIVNPAVAAWDKYSSIYNADGFGAMAGTLVGDVLAGSILALAAGGSSVGRLGRVGTGVPDTKLTPSEFARSLQGEGDYPGKDIYRDITLKKGKIIYGGTPGQSEFYTTASALERSDYSSQKLFDGVQVAPGDPARIPIHPETGLYRPGVTAYEVIDDISAAFGRTLANPQHGSGGLPQIVIENYQDYLKPLYSIPLKK